MLVRSHAGSASKAGKKKKTPARKQAERSGADFRGGRARRERMGQGRAVHPRFSELWQTAAFKSIVFTQKTYGVPANCHEQDQPLLLTNAVRRPPKEKKKAHNTRQETMQDNFRHHTIFNAPARSQN